MIGRLVRVLALTVITVPGVAAAQQQPDTPVRATAPESRGAAAIARVRTFDLNGASTGGGAGAFVGEGLFLTSLQVVDRAPRATVVTACCGEFDVEGVVAVDEARDLALLRIKVEKESVRWLEIAPEAPARGETVRVAIVIEGVGVALAGNQAISRQEWPGYGAMLHVRMPINALLSTTPVLDGQDRLCGIVVVGGGNATSLASVVPPALLERGALVPMQEFARRDPSALVAARREVEAGVEHADAHEFARAAAAYRRALEIEPSLWRAHWLLGVALDSMGRTEQSIESLLRAAELCPSFSEAVYSLGLVRLKLDQRQEAVAAFDRAIELDPLYANAHGMKGAALFGMDRVDDAVACVKRATEVAPGDISHVKNLTFMSQDSERRDELPAAWRRYCRAQPQDAEGWLMLASFLDPETNNDESVKAYRKAAEIDPDDAETQLRLGMCLLLGRRFDEAAAALDRCLKLEPGNRMARQAKAVLDKERKEKGAATPPEAK